MVKCNSYTRASAQDVVKLVNGMKDGAIHADPDGWHTGTWEGADLSFDESAPRQIATRVPAFNWVLPTLTTTPAIFRRQRERNVRTGASSV
jgi:hypothetical protein